MDHHVYKNVEENSVSVDGETLGQEQRYKIDESMIG